jgi:hypothetical protein
MFLNMDRNTLWGAAGGMVFEQETSWDVADRFRSVETVSHEVMRQVLSRQEEYVEFGGDYCDRRNKPKTVARLVARLALAKLGYEVDLKPQPAAPTEPASGATTAEGSSTAEALPWTSERPRRRGRPCKSIERGIICKHQGAGEGNSLIQQPASPGRFS